MWKKEKKQETQEVSPEKEEGRDLYEWAQALVCSVLAVVLLFTFVIRLIGVDGHSMVPTLQDGDRLLVLNAMLDQHISGKRDNWRQIWCIFMFLVWYDEYFVKR